MRSIRIRFVVAAALGLAVAAPAAANPTRLRGVLLIDFGAGIPNPTPSLVHFVVPKKIESRFDLNDPADGKKGFQIPERCQGAFTIDLSSNPSCNELGGALRGSAHGGRVLLRLETFNKKMGGVFEAEVTSGADCSLFEGNVTSGDDPFMGDLECSSIGEAFVWQAEILSQLASTVPPFFGIDPAKSQIKVKVFNAQRTADSGIGINNSSVEVVFRRP